MIFDFDGTLLDSLPVCYHGFRSAFLKFLGKEYSDREIDLMFGPSEEGIIKRMVPDAWEECLKAFLQAYDEMHPVYVRSFPEIEQALKLLRERNLKLAVVSGKGRGSMDISLKHSGLGRFFDIIETGSEQGAKKPFHIKKVIDLWQFLPGETAYMGDIPYDIKAAKEVGAIALGAAWAAGSKVEEMKQAEPAFLFEEVGVFLKWIRDELEYGSDLGKR